MQKLTIVKLGGSLITDKNRPLVSREAVIKRLAEEIKSASKNYKGKLVIGHGSGSFGHASAAKYQTQKGIVNRNSIKGVSEVADVASQITKIVIKQLRKAGIPAVAFAPGSFIVSSGQKLQEFFIEPIKEALGCGVAPLVYGDVVFDKKQGFCIFSTEKVIGVIVGELHNKYKIEQIIYCGITDGVYDEDGETIPLINSKTFGAFKKAIGVSGATDVTGGMIHKVQESLELAKKYKTRVLIINGIKPGNLKKAILSKKVAGTKISK
ncbi:isopentenyl phosphate kinase [Patescibacteria group bacterium]|nr:isopentenyl phosphate kinase [Patescibacteria group bacterium]